MVLYPIAAHHALVGDAFGLMCSWSQGYSDARGVQHIDR